MASLWLSPVAVASQGSSPSCSLEIKSHKFVVPLHGRMQTPSRVRSPMRLRSRPVTSLAIFIPRCGPQGHAQLCRKSRLQIGKSASWRSRVERDPSSVGRTSWSADRRPRRGARWARPKADARSIRKQQFVHDHNFAEAGGLVEKFRIEPDPRQHRAPVGAWLSTLSGLFSPAC